MYKRQEWEIQTFVRSSSTADERYQHDRKTDKIIENTDFEIILRPQHLISDVAMIHMLSVIMITDNGRLCVMRALDVPTVQAVSYTHLYR